HATGSHRPGDRRLSGGLSEVSENATAPTGGGGTVWPAPNRRIRGRGAGGRAAVATRERPPVSAPRRLQCEGRMSSGSASVSPREVHQDAAPLARIDGTRVVHHVAPLHRDGRVAVAARHAAHREHRLGAFLASANTIVFRAKALGN